MGQTVTPRSALDQIFIRYQQICLIDFTPGFANIIDHFFLVLLCLSMKSRFQIVSNPEVLMRMFHTPGLIKKWSFHEAMVPLLVNIS